MIAIVLGTALTFWLVEIRPAKKNERSQAWPVCLFIALILITPGLAVCLAG